MVARDADSLDPLDRRVKFDRYVLDLERGCLLLDGEDIPLRPKTFALLHHLVDHCGRLVTKEELFAAVWPKLVVTDDTLVQSVGELRRAFGDDGRRLIRTVPRRGYRLESTASLADAPPRAPRRRVLAGAFVVAALLAVAIYGVARLLPAGPSPPDVEHVQGGARAIAVLPFRSHGEEATRDYFADGLTQDVIAALGRFPELTVMSWNAVSPYRDSPAKPDEIARRLAVKYQVEGSVIRTGERMRVSAQLVAADGRVLWSSRFDNATADLFAVQARIATEIAGALAVGVTHIEQQRVLAKSAESVEAYDYVLRARSARQRPTRANTAEARTLLRRAIETDQSCAAAYAALAETHLVAIAMGWAESPFEELRRAEELAGNALRLDDSEVRAHVALGRVHVFRQRYDLAKAEMDRTLEINPSNADGLAGRGNILMWMGQTDAAIASLEQAQRIDPQLNAIDRFALSLAYYSKGHYDTAIAQAERNLRETGAASFSRVVLAAAYAQRNQTAEASRVVAVIRATDPAFDAQSFGSKFLNPADLAHLREGFRKAGLLAGEGASRPSV